jgi:phage terminase large subunit-like protein
VTCPHPTARALAPGGVCPICSPLDGGRAAPGAPAAEPPPKATMRSVLYHRLRHQAALDELARRRLSEFLRQAWAHVEGTLELTWAFYLDAICDHVQAQLEDWARARSFTAAEWADAVERSVASAILRCQNQVINLPPRALKTTIVTICATAWAWVHWPEMRIITFSGNPRVTKDASRKFVHLVQSDWYKRLADGAADRREARDTGAKATGWYRWRIPRDPADEEVANVWADKERGGVPGGTRKARGVESDFTGEGADLLLCDDPISARDVHSDAKRQSLEKKWDDEVYNRVNDPTRSIRIIVMQRLAVDDLTAHVLSNEGEGHWHVLRLAMEYDGPRARRTNDVHDDRVGDWLGWSDPRGDADWSLGPILHPLRFPSPFIASAKKHEHRWLAQYQQKPESLSAGLFKRHYWNFWTPQGAPVPTRPRPDGCKPRDAHPARVIPRDKWGRLVWDWVELSVDATFKKTADGSRVGILAIAGIGDDRFVLDDASRRRDFPETKSAIRSMVGTGGTTRLERALDESVLGTSRHRLYRVLIERKANGEAIISEVTEQVPGLSPWPAQVEVVGVETGDDNKLGRAYALSGAVANGHYYLLDDAAWSTESCGDDDDRGFLPEVSVFPNGRRDDRVDCLSQSHNTHALATEGDWSAWNNWQKVFIG